MAAGGTTVEKLYELCEVIDTAKDKSECTEEYKTILSGTKGGSNEKRFASQLIVRYFHHFADLKDQALEAMFELCEDEDVNIRKSVIKELPSLCKEDGKHISKIADVLVQLLQTEDAQEHQIVNIALANVLAGHVKETLATIFGHISNPDSDLIRERAVKFVCVKIKTLQESVLTKEIEDYVLKESRKILLEASGDEFVLFMQMLGQLRSLQTVQGRQLLLDIVTEQAELDKPFEPEDPDRLDQIFQCTRHGVPFMSKNVQSTKFFTYLCDHVYPALEKIKWEGNENPQLEFLRLGAETVQWIGDLQNSNEKMDVLLKSLIDYLPLPPSVSSGENGSASASEEPDHMFSEIECLLYMLHHLGRRYPQFLTAAEKAETVKDLRKRLQYLARVVQLYVTKLREILAKMTKEELKLEENRLKPLALRTTSNISVLAKDLLHVPPIYKSTVHLSWKPPEQKEAAPAPVAEKRTSEQNETTGNKKPRNNVEIYQPPSGKFSEKAGTYQNQAENAGGSGGGGGGYRGNFRGGRGRGVGGGTRGGFRGRGGGGRGQFRGGPYTWKRS